MRNDPDELFRLVRMRAEAIARRPARDREAALSSLRDEHKRSGVEAGMTLQAAIAMADQLDIWVRASLEVGSARREGRLGLH